MANLVEKFLYDNEVASLKKQLSDRDKKILEDGKKELLKDGISLSASAISAICANSENLKRFGLAGPILGALGILLIDSAYYVKNTHQAQRGENRNKTISFKGSTILEGNSSMSVPPSFQVNDTLAQSILDYLL